MDIQRNNNQDSITTSNSASCASCASYILYSASYATCCIYDRNNANIIAPLIDNSHTENPLPKTENIDIPTEVSKLKRKIILD